MMHTIIPYHTFGKPSVDLPVLETIQRFELAFPNRIRSYYVLGSYADGHAVAGSDIDMYVLFKETLLLPEEYNSSQNLARSCMEMSNVLRLEVNLVSEQDLEHYHSIMRVALKRNSILLYGEDTRAAMTLPSREAYIRDATDGVLEFLQRLRGNEILTYPLDYPDSNGLFYGYDRMQRLTNSDSLHRGTRELVECALRIATALLALKTDCFVATKRESAEVYHEAINDNWSNFLIDMFELSKIQWIYAIPEGEDEQAALQSLCQHMLAFENYYLLVYRVYLLTLLHSDDEQAIGFAVQRLQVVRYTDEEILATGLYNPDYLAKLYQQIDGLNARFPNGNTPFRIMTRLCEEAGELAAEVNHFEGMGVKLQKRGEPDKQALAKEIEDVLRAALNIAHYYGIEQELKDSIDVHFQKMKNADLMNFHNQNLE
jgi:NTP pyrophosphatase (non-canonical NTP hydrolase)/predicted nucleotidyltransferase